ACLPSATHALITTPGATRFYRSAQDAARQSLAVTVADGARLEWLPSETIAHSGCLAQNRLRFELAPGAEMLGWDVLALGLPASGDTYTHGHFHQQIELPGVWLERALVNAGDRHLLDSPLGWAGHRVMATMWFATGTPIDGPRVDQLLAVARDITEADPCTARIGVTAPNPNTVVLRMLAPHTEAALGVLRRVWGGWRHAAWQLAPCLSRLWQT
ncbi:MAG TPA: urease accessory protein UreD, partial [Rubrivivax sp.]|nr:urease accessory protein UreD [Rubrivivax sp.]